MTFAKIYLGKIWKKNSSNFEHMTHYDIIRHMTKISKFRKTLFPKWVYDIPLERGTKGLFNETKTDLISQSVLEFIQRGP